MLATIGEDGAKTAAAYRAVGQQRVRVADDRLEGCFYILQIVEVADAAASELENVLHVTGYAIEEHGYGEGRNLFLLHLLVGRLLAHRFLDLAVGCRVVSNGLVVLDQSDNLVEIDLRTAEGVQVLEQVERSHAPFVVNCFHDSN